MARSTEIGLEGLRKPRKIYIRIFGVLVKIRSENLSNTSQTHYRSSHIVSYDTLTFSPN
jgi:hypothetical protein